MKGQHKLNRLEETLPVHTIRVITHTSCSYNGCGYLIRTALNRLADPIHSGLTSLIITGLTDPTQWNNSDAARITRTIECLISLGRTCEFCWRSDIS